MAQERPGYRGPGPETKGGGLRGGPKRWTGRGPQPARHIPWPEIFKHHISVIEGHLKMTDMIRKHTVEGTGNWRTICQIIERTKEMLRAAKDQSRTFVPPYDTRERVPLGSSSVSMYPGYSPADHEYGKAAEEYGRIASAARAQGIEIKPTEFDYEIGQAKGIKRKSLGVIRAAKTVQEGGSGSVTGSGSDGPTEKDSKSLSANAHVQEEQVQESHVEVNAENGNPAFFIDVNPTPVDLPMMKVKSPKRGASSPEPVEEKKHKKIKRKHVSGPPATTNGEGIEYEDISQEVDARLKEKEEKRKHKGEKKKRKRDPGESNAIEAEAPSAATELEKPKKKKSKKTEDSDQSQVPVMADNSPKKRQGVNDDGEHEEGKKKKRKKTKE